MNDLESNLNIVLSKRLTGKFESKDFKWMYNRLEEAVTLSLFFLNNGVVL